MSRYILVADEMGTPGMAPGTSGSFVFGGYVVHDSDLPKAYEAWMRVKKEMCGTTQVELKWKHFFVHADDPDIQCPLIVKNRLARRNMVTLALKFLFHQAPLVPVVAVSQKGRATDAFVVQSRKGKDKIDDDLMWLGPVALFGVFLHARRATGKLWFDQLGSEKQQTRRQEAWSKQLRLIRAGECHPDHESNLRKLLAIDEKIELFDSRTCEAVQIADFVCGVVWQAAEGDEAFLAMLQVEFGPSAERQGLGILHLE